MAESILEGGISLTRHNMESYFKTHDVAYMHDDVVFTNLGTGEVYRGKEAVGKMLHEIYHVSFDAHLEITNYLVTEEKAFLEGNFIGTHIGEINGMPATHKQVNTPLVVTYDLQNGLIKQARVYMLLHIMMKQLSE